MFATGRSGAQTSAVQGKPAARDGPESDDDDWLRVGRSFKGAAPPVPSVNERALQVYSKAKKKRSRADAGSDRSSDSDSERETRRPRKHGKDHKKKKKKSSKKKTESKKHKSRHRYGSDESSDSSSSTSDRSGYRRSAKQKRRTEGEERRRRRHHDDDVDRYRRPTDELALLSEPAHGELEVYARKRDAGGEKLFEFDCVGDRENLVYGGLYRHEQPQYHLATRRSIIDGSWIVERRQQSRQHALQDAEDPKGVHANRYFGRNAKIKEKGAGTRRFHLAYSQRRLARRARGSHGEELSSATGEVPFIPLDALVDGELDGVLMDQEGTQLARELDASNNSASSILWQTDQENIERFMVERQKDLNEQVATNPHDIEAWLDVIAFQGQTLRLSAKRLGNELSSKDLLVLEKQKAVWSKAMEKNPDSRRLRLLQLNLLWHEQQAKREVLRSDSYRALVEHLLESDKTSTTLWVKLIQCSQQTFGEFSMPLLRDLYARVISVLNKELVEHMKNTASPVPVVARNSSSFIHVMGANSLLGNSDPYDAEDLDGKATRLSVSLVEFHRSMLRAEVSAGYTERAVALAQALIEFNSIGQGQDSSPPTAEHPQQVLAFSKRWSEETQHFGQVDQGGIANLAPELPGPEVAIENCSELVRQVRSSVRTPDTILSSAHAADLLGPFGVDEVKYKSDNEEDSTSIDGTNTKTGGRWVYSNLHGQRIWIADSNESKEYERILDELRGSAASRERQLAQDKKLHLKNTKKAHTLTKLGDERADYPPIDPDEDGFIAWLLEETRAEVSQWEPLQPSNPDHSELLEEQPDRAILTEEILPFVFRMPQLLHSSSVLSLLEVVGVRLANTNRQVEDPTHTLSLDDFDEYSAFTTPILKALDPRASESICLSPSGRCSFVMKAINQHVNVSAHATVDRSRIKFLRNLFEGALDHFSNKSSDDCRLLKVMWMEFELEVLLSVGKRAEASAAFRSFCQALLASSGEATSANVDAWLMSVYASLELRLGNTRQMARICDKTVHSLDLAAGARSSKLCRAFHRLIFLRVHQELLSGYGELGMLKAFYVLWRVWAPESSDTLESIAKQHKKNPVELMSRLRKHLEKHQLEIIGKYRFELQIVLDQCKSKKSSIQACSSLSCNVAFALFNLCGAVYVSHGYLAAKQEFDLFLNDRSSAVGEYHHQQCWLMLFAFSQTHHISERVPSLSPREWRETIARGIGKFPLEPVFLRLFVDAETSNTMSQSLRKYFHDRRMVWQRSLDSPELIEWLFALLCEFARAERCGIKYSTDTSTSDTSERVACCVLHRWGKNRPAVERIRRVFEEMVSQLKTSGAAVGWRLYLRFELAVGKVDAARKVFYRGLVKCPWSKAFYTDGIRLLRPYLNHGECREILDFLAAKELHVRVDI